MGRAVILLRRPSDYRRASAWISNSPRGTSVELKSPRRNTDQNALLWVLLGAISKHVVWYGQKLSSEDWKDVLTASLRRARVVPGVDAGTFVPLGMRTSDMTKDEFAELIELVYAFGAQQGVVFDADGRGVAA